jgi:hypothetical protein
VTENAVHAFLDGLGELYAAAGSVDPCSLFTATGWQTAVDADWRLANVLEGRLRFRQQHLLRLRNEVTNEPVASPPRFVADAIYDIAAGARVVNVATATETGPSGAPERTGFRLKFVFDRDRWLVDRVEALGQDERVWLGLRLDVPAQPHCIAFERDPEPAAFDDRANRPWCDVDGRGRRLLAEQLSFHTRFPCNQGHAAILTIGRPLGTRIDPLVRWEYVRDPAGEFEAHGWLRSAYDGDGALPAAASYTGWTNGNIELWIAPEQLDEAVFIVRGKIVERWARAAEEWGVTDCN